MIWIITVTRPGDDKPTCWYMDDPVEYRQVCEFLKNLGVKYHVAEDYVTDATEFKAWWRREN